MQRVLRTGAPLSLNAIRQVAPAVFAEHPHSSRGERYLYVPTIRPLEALLDNGWGVYEASQQRSRAADRDPYTKHMLRLRKLADFDVRDQEGCPETVLINAHDGTAAYHAKMGYFRYVCSNGMMAGVILGGFKVQHTISSKTTAEVLTAMEATVTEKMPGMLANINQFKETEISPEAQQEFAELALRLRYGDTLPPFRAQELLQVRRDVDAGNSVWRVLSRIQENVLNGGWATRSVMHNRASTVRSVERVSAVTKINMGLWDHAVELCK